MKSFRVGLALGGGAARGLAHIGVLKAMEDLKIPIDIIVGTSAGALVGACYALTRNVDEVRKRVVGFLQSKEFRKTKLEFLREQRKGTARSSDEDRPKFFDNLKSFLRKGIFYTSSVTRISYIPEEHFRLGIDAILDDIPIEATQIPFAAVAVDLVSGEEVVMKKGELRTAVRASCAIPGVFPPTPMDGRLLVDGSWVDTVPVEPTRQMGAEFVIAVDISREMDDPGNLHRGLNVIFRTNAISRHLLKKLQIREANIVVRPDIGDLHWADFGKVEEGIEKGYAAVQGKADEIRSKMKRAHIKWVFRSMIKRAAPSS